MQVYRTVPVLQQLGRQAVRTLPVVTSRRNFFLTSLIKTTVDLTCLSTCLAGVRRWAGFDLKPMTDTIRNDALRNTAQAYLFVGEKCADYVGKGWDYLVGEVKKENEKQYREYQEHYEEYQEEFRKHQEKNRERYNKYYDQFHRYQTASNYDQSKHSYPECKH